VTVDAAVSLMGTGRAESVSLVVMPLLCLVSDVRGGRWVPAPRWPLEADAAVYVPNETSRGFLWDALVSSGRRVSTPRSGPPLGEAY
jgi:hypothetical protein